MREALLLDQIEGLVVLDARKLRLQILEGKRGRMRALQEGNDIARGKKRLAVLCLQPFPLPSLYLEPRAKLNTFCASIYLIVQKLEHGEDYKRRQGKKKVERDGHGHGSPPRHAPIAVPDRDHGAIPPEDRIGAAKALGFPRESRVAPEARAGGLVEEDELAAVARRGSAAVIEQGFDRIGPDAALLHAGSGVFREDAGHAHLSYGDAVWWGRWLRV